MKTGLGSLQGVLFTNNLDLTNKLAIAQTLSNLNSITFDGNPTILPLPNDAPIEVPRIILNTTDNLFNLNIAPSRVDLFFNEKSFDNAGIPTSKLDSISKKLIPILSEISDIIIANYSTHINRSAFVSNHILKLEISSISYIMDNFIKSDTIDMPNEVQLNFLTKKELGKYKVNQWLRFNTLKNQKNLSDNSAISLILDINTFSEIDYNFKKSTLIEFLNSCESITKKEISKFTHGGNKNG